MALKAFYQLEFAHLTELARYRTGLLTGSYAKKSSLALRWLEIHPLTAAYFKPLHEPQLHDLLPFSNPIIKKEADLICEGKFKTFGIEITDLDLSPHGPLVSWTEFERGRSQVDVEDIKFVWEPARFGWAIVLARSFRLTNGQRYLRTFISLAREFMRKNPPFHGPNWMSAQEVAIRLISLAFACSVFWDSPILTESEKADLVNLMAIHAIRLPITLVYAKAQNNNHLLLEAAGLITAGSIMPGVKRFRRCKDVGWKLFHNSLQQQIGEDGNFIQQSNNYQRLMLQATLWVWSIARNENLDFPKRSFGKLVKAVDWLACQVEPANGRTPNLGPNDGALLFPLSTAEYLDYRPTLQAASCAFCGKQLFNIGKWDEMAIWLGINPHGSKIRSPSLPDTGLQLDSRHSHAFLRAIHFKDRPGHSDQLHVDLWANGENILLDPGTFLYNAREPWNNSLAAAKVHNSLSLDGLDPMTRAGKFLWLDWAQARIVENTPKSCTAEHHGYRKSGFIHRRTLSLAGEDRWVITDDMRTTASTNKTHECTLHWLLPDWKWRQVADAFEIWLERAALVIRLHVQAEDTLEQPHIQVIRAGKLIHGKGEPDAVFGWYSPTYALKLPVLSFRYSFHFTSAIKITTSIQITRRRWLARSAIKGTISGCTSS